MFGRVDGLSQEHLELHGVSYCTIGALVSYCELFVLIESFSLVEILK